MRVLQSCYFYSVALADLKYLQYPVPLQLSVHYLSSKVKHFKDAINYSLELNMNENYFKVWHGYLVL